MRLIEFKDHFPNEKACDQHWRNERESVGITCKKCLKQAHYWIEGKSMWQCKDRNCKFRTSLKSGTVMENSNLSISTWYIAMHLMTSSKNNISALELQRQLGMKYYQPVFEMAHKLRIIMGKREDKYTLEGNVELDEGFFSNSKPLEINEFTGETETLKRGKGSQKKTAVLVMHSFKKVPISLQKNKHSKNTIPKFLKMKVLYKIDSLEINDTMKPQIEKKADLVSDKNTAYKDLEMDYESHTPHNTKKVEITKVLPWVHTAITNMKGAIYNVYKGITESYMQNYMDEFCFKFNRRYFGTNIFDRLVISAVSYRWN